MISYSRDIFLPVCVLSLIAFCTIIYFYKTNTISNKEAQLYAAISITLLFLNFFIYSLVTGETIASGFRIKKEDTKILYYVMTSFWGIISLLGLVFIGIKI